MRRVLAALVVLLAWAVPAAGQTLVGSRFQLTSGPCTLRSGTGVPSNSLGAVCDTYFRADSPYTVYVKIGASAWAEVYRSGGTDVAVADGGTGLSSWTTGQLVYASGSTTLAGLSAVATGQVLTSAGTGTAPAWSASPSVTALTASGAVQGATVTGTTSVSTPTLTASGNLTLSPTGDIITSPTGLDVLPGTGYTYNLGALTNKYLTLHAAELWVETLVAQNTLATIGGRVLVGPTTSLTSDLASGATSMSVKHNSLANGDRVLLEANGQVEWIAVASAASGAGPYTYTITRNLDGSGANNWTAGDAVFNTGTTNSGFIDLYSSAGVISGSGPTIVGNVRTGTTYNNIAARWAIGNLNGLYGYGATTYGTAFGDPSNTNITIDATNGFRIRSGTTNKLTADTSGNLSIVGDLSVGTSGIIRSGATSYASGTGYVLEYNGGTPRLRVGTTSGNRVDWDGSNLTVVSANATINSNGVKITSWNTLDTSCPGSCQDVTRAYAFSPASAGFMGLQGLVGTTSGAQELHLINDVSGGSAPYAITRMTAEGTSLDLSSGGTIAMTAGTSVSFSTDLTVFTNNGSTSSMPYIRSDGNYLVIESRTAANGGVIYLAHDNAANIYLGPAGGVQFLYNPTFQSSAPNWVTSLAQTTVGAAGGGSALPATPAGYVKIKVNGTDYVVPAYNP